MTPRHTHLIVALISLLAGAFGLFKVTQAWRQGYYTGKRSVVYSTDAGFDFVLGAGTVLSVLALVLAVFFIWKAWRDS